MAQKDVSPELLAPAGSVAIAEAAFDHGADAVYVGLGQENLRAHAPFLTANDLRVLLDIAQSRGKRVYVALNSMPDEDMLARIRATIAAIAGMEKKPHAIIVSDPGVLSACRKELPGIPLHLSTQTGVFNSATLRFWKEQGITRIVLPRELTLEQIRVLAADPNVETELFIHGAMCVSVSGRCLLGAYLDERHPNKGDCTQPCRLRYRIDPVDPAGHAAGIWLEAEEASEGVFLLNSKDLCVLPILPDILKTSVRALKIEGRNKSLHYVATVVRVYRQAIDACRADPDDFAARPEWERELDAIEHRPYTTGFYHGEKRLQAVFIPKSKPNVTMAGIVKGAMPDGSPVIDVRSVFRPGDRLQVLPINKNAKPFIDGVTQILDLCGSPLAFAPLHRVVTVRGIKGLQPGDLLRIVHGEQEK
jgi:U32 family peptidase